MINFQSLPKESPFKLPEAGLYIATIKDATMKQPKDLSKPMYLNLRYELADDSNNKAGSMFDMMFESDADFCQFKLSRFLVACEIPLVGEMELKDVAKLVVGKRMGIMIEQDLSNAQYPKVVVDMKSTDGYFPMNKYPEVYAAYNHTAPSADTFINEGTEEPTPDNSNPAPAEY